MGFPRLIAFFGRGSTGWLDGGGFCAVFGRRAGRDVRNWVEERLRRWLRPCIEDDRITYELKLLPFNVHGKDAFPIVRKMALKHGSTQRILPL